MNIYTCELLLHIYYWKLLLHIYHKNNVVVYSALKEKERSSYADTVFWLVWS